MNIVQRIADNQLENNLDEYDKITKTEDLRAEQESYDSGMIVETSGTSTGEGTPIHYSDEALQNVLDDGIMAMRMAGFDEDDVMLNLAAPRPHFSGWFLNEAADQMGYDVVNSSVKDYHEVIGTDDAERVTVTLTVPEFGCKLVREMENEYGEKPKEIFPNMEKAILSGELFTESHREILSDGWGFDRMEEMYANSEAGAIAQSTDGSSEMVPFLDRYIMEIIPDSEDQDRPVDIREFDEPATGRVLITDPRRDFGDYTGPLGEVRNLVDEYEVNLPESLNNVLDSFTEREGLVRVDPGDAVEVLPRDDIPRIKVLGKYDAMPLGGAQVYEEKLHHALSEAGALPDDYSVGDDDWVAVKSRENGKLMADFFVPDLEGLDEEVFFDVAYDQNPALEEVDRLNSLYGMDFHPSENYDVDWNTIKAKRLVDETEA